MSESSIHLSFKLETSLYESLKTKQENLYFRNLSQLIHVMIHKYLDSKESCNPLDKRVKFSTGKKHLSIKIPKSDNAVLLRKCDEEKCSISSLIRAIIIKYLKD